MGGDPDAPWKPGYRGGHTTASSERAPRRIVPVLAACLLVAVGLIGHRHTEVAEPEVTVQDRWTVAFPTSRLGAVTATESVVVLVIDRPGSVVVLDRRDGSERWRRSAPGASTTGLDVVDQVVVVRHVDGDGRGAAVGFDVETGVRQWDRALAVGETIEVVDGATRRRDRVDVREFAAETGEIGEAVEDEDEDEDEHEGAAAPTDHVVRGLSPGRPLSIEVDGATVVVMVDDEVLTVEFRRWGSPVSNVHGDDPRRDHDGG